MMVTLMYLSDKFVSFLYGNSAFGGMICIMYIDVSINTHTCHFKCCASVFFSDQFLKVSLIFLGFITFLVAALGARRVEGVDVDLTLISKALKCLGVVTEILPNHWKGCKNTLEDERLEPPNHPISKGNDLKQTSRELCSMLIFRGVD